VKKNEGIQATNVSADVMAVGHRARASKSVISAVELRELQQCAAQLEFALLALKLNASARGALDEDVAKLKASLVDPKVDPTVAVAPLKSLIGKLKMVGVAVKETAALIEPVQSIAKVLGVSMQLLGL
jgi:hypothetical protein